MTINSNAGQVQLADLPNKCPFCHRSVTPNALYGYKIDAYNLAAFMYCPDKECAEAFIGYYEASSSQSKYYNFKNRVSQGVLIGKDFSQSISEISEQFVEIYNQAYSAEQQNLKEICGVGYRKALEFLIKDYAILKFPDEKDKIEKKLLGVCIKDYIENNRIKSVAKRAVWLGNDETHYIRKWEGKNLSDLKILIDLTVHWLEMEKLTETFEEQMPDE